MLTTTVNMDVDVQESIKNHVDVTLKLTNHVFSTVTKTELNLVFSPLSISVVLGLIAAGSNGRTLNELLAFLNSKSADDLNAFYSQVVSAVFADGRRAGGPRLSVSNGAWIEQTLPPLNASFKHILENVYKAVSESVDFKNKATEVVKRVNLRVEKKSRGLIKDILSFDGVNKDTRLILANVLYFKGLWVEKFNASVTEINDFQLLNGSSVPVPFMRSKNDHCVQVFEGFKVLRLPYKRGEDKRRFSMYIFLPDAKDGLPSLMHKVTSEPGLLEHCLPKYSVPVGEFRIPKFKFSFEIELLEVLKELGVVSPFFGEGITKMVEGEELYVSKITHKCFIEVNEDGTEAAAATVDEEMSIALFPDEDFVADHPFLYFIREDSTGVIILIGTLINPLLD